MSDRAKLLTETKKEILSLLVCLGATGRNQGISVKQFSIDYREQIGIPIPYKQLGYATLEDFFHEIPDTVRLTFGREGPTLNAVENDSISHIVALVDSQKSTVLGERQKRAKKKAGAVGRGGYRGGYSGGHRGSTRGGYGGRGSYTSARYNNNSYGDSSDPYSRPAGHSRSNSPAQNVYSASQNVPQNRYNPSHPSTTRNTISRPDPQTHRPTKLTTQAPLERYEPEWLTKSKSTVRAPLQWEEPPPAEKVKPEPVPAPPTVPVTMRKMIRELLTSYPNGIYGDNVSTAFSRRFGDTLNPTVLGFKNMYCLFAAMSDIVELEEMDDDFRIKQLGLRPIATRPNKPVPDVPVSKRKYDESGDGPQVPSSVSTSKRRHPNDYCHDDDLLRNDIQKVLVHHSRDGIWNKEFPNKFKEIIGIDLPWKQLGYPSVIDMMGELSDVVVIERESPHGDWKLFDMETKTKMRAQTDFWSEPAPRPRSAPLPVISEALKEAVRQVVCSHVEGLPLYELPEIFKEMTGKPLGIREIGFSSLDTFVQRLTSDNILNLDYRGEGLVLLTAVHTEPATGYLLNKPGLGQKRQSVPPDAVGHGVRYRHQVFPEPSVDSYVEMYLLTVDDLSTFWLQIKGKDTSEAVEDLLDHLEAVYEGESSLRYCIPDSMIVSGQIAAARFQDGNWYRVSILERTDEHFVKVYFADWGGTYNVHKENLRFLKNIFLQQLAAQGLRAKFYGIDPPPGGYTASATNRLIELASGEAKTGANRTLHALIVEVDKINEIMSVCLVDMQGENEVHIQDVLVEEGYAVFNNGQSLGESETGVAEMTPVEPTASSNVAYVSPMKMNTEGMEDVEYDSEQGSPTCVKMVQLTEEHSIHIINFENEPYVMSSEISTFMWDKDLLRSMLRQKRIEIQRKVLPRDDYTELFHEFMFYEIPGITDHRGEPKTHLTMYSLGGIPTILDAFASPSKDLQPIRKAILREQENFNVDDPYWRGEDPDDASGSDTVSETDSYTMDQLEVAEKSLQHRRSQMVALMVKATNKENTAYLIDQLENVERNIADVRKKIRKEKKREDRSNEEFIGHCISQQYEEPASSETVKPAQPDSYGTSTTSNTTPAGFGAGLPAGFGGVPTAGSGMTNPIDMSSLMMGMNMMSLSAGMGRGMGAMPGMGNVGGMPGIGGASSLMMMNAMMNPMTSQVAPLQLTPEQQQFMLMYNQMLQQPQALAQTAMLNMANMGTMGVPGFGLPAANMNSFSTPTVTPQLNTMPQMSIGDLSMMVLGGQGRGVMRPNQEQQQSGSRPGGLQDQ